MNSVKYSSRRTNNLKRYPTPRTDCRKQGVIEDLPMPPVMFPWCIQFSFFGCSFFITPSLATRGSASRVLRRRVVQLQTNPARASKFYDFCEQGSVHFMNDLQFCQWPKPGGYVLSENTPEL